MYPKFFYNEYNWIINSNYITFEIIMILIHIMPIYLFRNKQKINSTNIENIIIHTIIYLILYDLIFHSSLKLYPLNENELIILVSCILFILYVVIKKLKLFDKNQISK
jgi:hypothetical protein